MTTAVDDACPLCGGTGSRPSLYRIASIPAHSCLLMDTREEALAVHEGAMELVRCPRCGYLANRMFDEALTAYSSRYEDSQAFSRTFVEYARGLARRWVEDWDLSGRTVAEVGAGRGDFSRLLVEAGAARVLAVDPTIDRARLGEAPGVEPVVRRVEHPEDLPACDAVVMRHVLEHVDAPRALLGALREALDGRPDAPVLVEVPDARRILAEGAFWDVYHEHCAYPTAETVRELFESCGFEVRSVSSVYDAQYLLVEATATGVPRAATLDPDVLGRLAAEADGFARRVGTRVERWRDLLGAAADDGAEVVVWGGGSKGTAFLAALGGLRSAVRNVVDVNPHVHGRFVAGTGHEIRGPEDLRAHPADLVVVMNPVYFDEITAEVARLSPGARIVALGR
ncbi:class I SAM-dependent methyltransferase [Phycicoccus sp.]|uniref:class I SAM-dependent methyltransferase n=1 Tax=Phycicoccus sp. TaxID=1902410 RepID=UPI002B920ED5|nr:class I SAM-dependent methyltransferase [Phycicoccus sp.]HMM93444.1 class I SAM-dependent methyltransferase [Phycicoccus sp.]